MARAPRTLADGRIRLACLTKKPADMKKITVTELQAGVELACRILKQDYKLGATASDTIDGEAELCSAGNTSVPGSSNYEGSVTTFRYLTADGKSDPEADVAWQALRQKGTTVWLIEREGPLMEKDWEAGDEISVYECITDTPQKPADRSGYIKRTVPLLVQAAEENATVAA